MRERFHECEGSEKVAAKMQPDREQEVAKIKRKNMQNHFNANKILFWKQVKELKKELTEE